MTNRGAERGEVEAFLFHEARLLDEHRFDEWLALFAEDGRYWIPLEHDQADPYETVSLIYDDRRALETRVRQLANPSRHAQTPRSWTSHLVGNVTIEEGSREDGALVARSNVQMLEARGERQRLFAGHCTHHLLWTGSAFRIALKRVDLVNCDSPMDGINVPI